MRMAITLLFLIISTCSWGKELPKLEGKPVLTISGKIENSNQNGAAVFDIAGLEKIGLVTMRTRNPWYNDQTRFEGIPMKKLMELVGAKGTVLSVTALNDYTTEIPIEDFTKYNVILAIKMNGQYMRVRDKGPLFIVYPYESNKELDNQVYYSRSAWQISKMVVE
ncbi:molybdopterin-dependent oxidoreductase [Enterobacter ludwigii]|uniref:molybdopterin-dependent oxidoreductase n=1 Tax=Enterobacter ludwigii TaxID=299767 RepID=UPI0024327359|nr:molybdopterin-dependent oxidoreductase [Enterobacter ludwigii]MDR0165137.1 molybdopterin-dependent oxidoreductase [Enterobacter ludwigii]WGA05813.1 molybdopterin-dependent oxidoreductase [Enterobacter ludwigii]